MNVTFTDIVMEKDEHLQENSFCHHGGFTPFAVWCPSASAPRLQRGRLKEEKPPCVCKAHLFRPLPPPVWFRSTTPVASSRRRDGKRV